MRRIRVAVFTSTRAEYGLLYWLMKDLQSHDAFELLTLVSGTHLSPEFGETVSAIERDGLPVTERVEMLLSSDSAVGVAKSFGLGVIGYSDALARLAPDVLVILGDRYEALAAAQTAFMLRIPVLHIHGGEVTEGAYDDAFRHCITKFSSLHFTSCEEYRQRVIQLGEQPSTVHNVGAIGLDHTQRTQLMGLAELSESLGFAINAPFFLVTYHPETLISGDNVEAFNDLLSALDQFPDHQIIFTYPNADDGGRQIIALIEAYVLKQDGRCIAVPSLGQVRYLSAVKYATAVVGNSSSGIIEVPSFAVPTVNIGSRQKGRISAPSVYHCSAERAAIEGALASAIAAKSSGELFGLQNPYGVGGVSEKIIDILLRADLSARAKTFFDLKETFI